MDDIFEVIKNHGKLYNHIDKAVSKYCKLRTSLENEVNNLYQLIELLNLIEKDTNSIHDIPLRDKLINWISSERQACDQVKDEFRLQLGQQLSKRLAETGKKVLGQYPVLRIGLYTVKFDFEFGEASFFFGPEIERIETKIPLSADVIYTRLTAFDEGLKSSPFDNTVFKQDIILAYQRLLKLSGKSPGEKLPLLKVMAEYVFIKQSKKFFTDPQGAYFKGFSRVSMSYDLYRFKKSGMTDAGIHLHVATFDATTDKANALWIPDNEEGEGTHYSYISLNNTESR